MTEHESKIQGYDQYIEAQFATEDDALRVAREEMEREGLPAINVSASEGKLLHVIALLGAPRRILEIGTLGGYSAIWLARALPADGVLISLEIDEHHADVARRNIERAGLSAKVEVRVGPALESLAAIETANEAPFDLVFIDADKDGYVSYLERSLPLLRDGGILLGDNTLPDAVLEPDGDSGAKRYNTAVAAHPDLVSIIIPVLRGEHIDGLLVSVKKDSARK
jgi:predicted O-methyltransferase YrrM